jgi:hypothetical protein
MLGLGYDASDALSLFTEFYNGILSGPGGNYLMNQTGLTYLLRDSIQLDLYYGWSLDGNIPSFGGFGVAFLL